MDDLTAREAEILHLAAEGLSNEEVAERLDISRRTVEAHLRSLFRKTGVSRRSQLAGLRADGGQSTLAAAERSRLDRYDGLVRRLVDRQLPLYEEQVEVTITVGGPDGADTVVERRWTVPKPYVVYRVTLPILPDDAVPADVAERGLTADVHGQDVIADVSTVFEPDGVPLAFVLFQPGLSVETEWTLRYRADGLWDPLRRSGVDRLYYLAAATRRQEHRPTVTRYAFRLVFPPGWTDVGLAETRGTGVVEAPVRQPSGQQIVVWRDADPTASRYEWEVRGTAPGKEPAGPPG